MKQVQPRFGRFDAPMPVGRDNRHLTVGILGMLALVLLFGFSLANGKLGRFNIATSAVEGCRVPSPQSASVHRASLDAAPAVDACKGQTASAY